MSGEWSQTPLIPPERQVQIRTGILLRSFDPASPVTARMAPRAKEESGTPQTEDAVQKQTSQFPASSHNEYI